MRRVRGIPCPQVYRIVSICLGTPPTTFTWEYYNKNKVYCSLGPTTPLEFYENVVKPHFNMDDKVGRSPRVLRSVQSGSHF